MIRWYQHQAKQQQQQPGHRSRFYYNFLRVYFNFSLLYLSSLISTVQSFSQSYYDMMKPIRPHVAVRKTSERFMSSSSTNPYHHETPKNIVVIGGGIQGASVAYYLAKMSSLTSENDVATNIIVLESKALASAASGKGGGFMARSWGDGSPTQKLHEIAFDLFDTELAPQLSLQSYRKLPVLSVSPGTIPLSKMKPPPKALSVIPNWLDGTVGGISLLAGGHDTAQVTPAEVVEKMLHNVSDRVEIILGTCTGITSTMEDDQQSTSQSPPASSRRVTGVKYIPTTTTTASSHHPNQHDTDIHNDSMVLTLPADAVCICAGPWACAAEDWFSTTHNDDDDVDTSMQSDRRPIRLPMEGIKSTSIVWKPPPNGVDDVDATALFCGEDHRYGTHLEVYPRPDGTIYICGIGGSDYIQTDELKQGAFRNDCQANQARVKAAVQSFTCMSPRYLSSSFTTEDEDRLDRVQACMRPCPPDALPYMGRVPGYHGAYINAGHNCWGIAWAPACGKAMAQLILQGECTLLELSSFDPGRFTPTAARGSRGRKQQGTNVGEQW